MTYNIHFHIPRQQGEEHTNVELTNNCNNRVEDIDPGILFVRTIALLKRKYVEKVMVSETVGQRSELSQVNKKQWKCADIWSYSPISWSK